MRLNRLGGQERVALALALVLVLALLICGPTGTSTRMMTAATYFKIDPTSLVFRLIVSVVD